MFKVCRRRSLSFLFICSRAFPSGKKCANTLLPFSRYRSIMIDLKTWRSGTFNGEDPASYWVEMKLPILTVYATSILTTGSWSSHFNVSPRSDFL